MISNRTSVSLMLDGVSREQERSTLAVEWVLSRRSRADPFVSFVRRTAQKRSRADHERER
jgi:hypothetical protein